MGKILVSIACCLVCLQGWQCLEAQAEDQVLHSVPGQTVVEEELRVKYPKLFDENTIVSFGIEGCRWCPAQKIHLQVLKARRYRVAYFDAEEHAELFNYLRDTEELPFTVIFVEGKIKKTFNGLTYWRKIAKEAQECKRK